MVMEEKPAPRQIRAIEKKRGRRDTSYVKRKECIKKKTMELATLCGISACMVWFGPNGEVETWPENPSEVKSVIEMYKEYGKDGRGRKVRRSSVGGSNEIDEDVAKREKLRRDLLGWDDDGWRLNGLSTESLMNFLGQLQSKVEVLTARIEFLKMINDQNNAAARARSYWFDNNTEQPFNSFEFGFGFGFGAENNVSISMGEEPYQTLQTNELPPPPPAVAASEFSFNPPPVIGFDADYPMSFTTPISTLNCYGGDVMSCNDCVSFDEIVEEMKDTDDN